MARRYEIDDAQWEKIRPYLGNTPKKTGRPQVDNRKLLNGVMWILRESISIQKRLRVKQRKNKRKAEGSINYANSCTK